MPSVPQILEPTAPRILPRLTDANRPFWTGGGSGRLLLPRCRDCRQWGPVGSTGCTVCGGPVIHEAVSGRGRVLTYTVNAHQFHPEIPPPNIIAIVVLDEQDDLRLATNLIGCDEEELQAGLPVTVAFEHHGEIYYPLFTPVEGG